jgi:glycosyltransferase involved in cell wall biosynthesis
MSISNNPLLSICITSYNRVSELERCLKSIKTENPYKIEIVVSEDCSPQKERIIAIVESFTSNSKYKVVFNSNQVNLGFDRNFKNLIELASGEYLLFVTDDDSLSEGQLDCLLNSIENTDFNVAFTPYYDCISTKFERKYASSFKIDAGMGSVIKFLYSSILLSGLIFKKSIIPQYNGNRFKDLIYSQVYVFAFILRSSNGYYFDIPIIKYIGDGGNAFGTNEGSEKNELMANRLNYLSNLEFHKSLIKTINFFDIDCNENLIKDFSKEYSLKSFTGMHYARSFGKNALIAYWDKMNSLGIKVSKIANIYFLSLYLFGSKTSEFIFSVPRFIVLFFRKRIV